MAFWVRVIGLRIVSTWSWAFMCECMVAIVGQNRFSPKCYVGTVLRERYALWYCTIGLVDGRVDGGDHRTKGDGVTFPPGVLNPVTSAR
jgi:hypothetical protein